MQHVEIDLLELGDERDFYRRFEQAFSLCGFGDNLDALWDALTGGVPLPLRLTLRHLDGHPAEAALRRMVEVMQEAERETDGAFSLRLR